MIEVVGKYHRGGALCGVLVHHIDPLGGELIRLIFATQHLWYCPIDFFDALCDCHADPIPLPSAAIASARACAFDRSLPCSVYR